MLRASHRNPGGTTPREWLLEAGARGLPRTYPLRGYSYHLQFMSRKLRAGEATRSRKPGFEPSPRPGSRL